MVLHKFWICLLSITDNYCTVKTGSWYLSIITHESSIITNKYVWSCIHHLHYWCIAVPSLLHGNGLENYRVLIKCLEVLLGWWISTYVKHKCYSQLFFLWPEGRKLLSENDFNILNSKLQIHSQCTMWEVFSPEICYAHFALVNCSHVLNEEAIRLCLNFNQLIIMCPCLEQFLK